MILGTILLVRPYRYIQEAVVNEKTKFYYRVERRHRPESHRQRADLAEEENQALRERNAELENLENENKALRERLAETENREENRALRERNAELERQLEERGSPRRRRRRNNPPPRE